MAYTKRTVLGYVYTSLYNVILVAGVIGMNSNARDQDNRNKGKGICPTIVRTRKKKQV